MRKKLPEPIKKYTVLRNEVYPFLKTVMALQFLNPNISESHHITMPQETNMTGFPF